MGPLGIPRPDYPSVIVLTHYMGMTDKSRILQGRKLSNLSIFKPFSSFLSPMGSLGGPEDSQPPVIHLYFHYMAINNVPV